MDFSNYKFRCSGLHHLMTSSRKKDDILSETTKTYLKDIFIQEMYHRTKPEIKGPACMKGTMVESDSLDLVQKVTGQTYFKNNDHFENEFIKGTPDLILDDRIVDIKSSWSIWTFANVDESTARKNYFYQVLGYMWLTGKQIGELNYCLVNTPEMLISDEIYRMSFRYGEEVAEGFRVNYIFDDISETERMKRFSFNFDQMIVDELTSRIIAAREYLNSMNL